MLGVTGVAGGGGGKDGIVKGGRGKTKSKKSRV